MQKVSDKSLAPFLFGLFTIGFGFLFLRSFMSALFLKIRLILLVAVTVVPGVLNAQTVVRVSTNLGDFSIELIDSAAPGTVQNFLNYINNGRYVDSIVHRSVPGFVIQGGGWTIAEGSAALQPVVTDDAIVNEPGISNTRGTVAMAKIAGNPDSATSQWFINLADNTSLDTDNGGFTVFGRVLDGGMSVADAIAALQRVTISASVNELPVVNFNGQSVTRENLVFTAFEVIDATVSNRFDSASGNLILSVDAGSAGIIRLSFSIESQTPAVVIRALPETVTAVATAESDFATFNEATGQLVIPELDVDGVIAYRNLVLGLTDAAQLLFTLQSFE
jgi:peptidyl-prolyl cis-trans isomerase A (cyclophilin A)